MKKMLICLMLLVGSICFGMKDTATFSEAMQDPVLMGPVFISGYVYKNNNPTDIVYLMTDGYGNICALDAKPEDRRVIIHTNDPNKLPNVANRTARLVWMNTDQYLAFLDYSIEHGFTISDYYNLRMNYTKHYPAPSKNNKKKTK